MIRPTPPLLTIAEAGEILRLGRTTLYDMAREYRLTNGQSGLPVRVIRGKLRVPREEFEETFGVRIQSLPDEPDIPDEPDEPDTPDDGRSARA